MRWALPLLSVVLWAPGSTATSTTLPTPQETRAEFDAVCHRLTAGDNIYFGSQIVGELRRSLATPGIDPLSEALTRSRLGQHLIRLDHQAEAIADLERALALTSRHDLDRDGSLGQELTALLAIAHLQLAEDQNCIAGHTARSCILPIAPEAVHAQKDHTRAAGDLFAELARLRPDDVQVRWLLNLTRMVSGDYPDAVPEPLRLPAGALASDVDFAPWTDIAPRLGVDSFDLSGGAIMDDFDGDGLLDLVSSSWDPCQPLKAFRNDGHGGFEDVAAAWGLDSQLGGLNVVQADFDGDGMLDLLVLRGAWLGGEGRIRNSLLRNDLKRPAGRFVDVTAQAGLGYPAYPSQAGAWADYDGDGDLDLYVGNEAAGSDIDPQRLVFGAGNLFPSQLLRNNGDGTFTDVARAAGVLNLRFAKGVAWGDYDNDGDPDLYISNIGPNRLYRNDGGSFTDVAAELGVVEPASTSFPTWFFDFDNDGDLDLFVGSFHATAEQISRSYFGLPARGDHPVVYRNEGGRFRDDSLALGLWRPLLVMGANYGDLDNDGWLDFYLGTGIPNLEALMPNAMYRNDQGRRFQDVTFAGGFGHLQKGHGVAFGDLDNDGRQEVFEQLGGAFPCDAYGNVLFDGPANANHWLVLRLIGRRANRFALGGRIEVRVSAAKGPSRSIHLLVGGGGSFGGSSLQQEVGLGAADHVDAITILWPGSGTSQTFRNVEVDRFYQATEGEPELLALDLAPIPLGTGPAAPAHHHESSSP